MTLLSNEPAYISMLLQDDLCGMLLKPHFPYLLICHRLQYKDYIYQLAPRLQQKFCLTSVKLQWRQRTRTVYTLLISFAVSLIFFCMFSYWNLIPSSMLTILLRSISLFFFLSCFYHTVCSDLPSEATSISLLQPFLNFHVFLPKINGLHLSFQMLLLLTPHSLLSPLILQLWALLCGCTVTALTAALHPTIPEEIAHLKAYCCIWESTQQTPARHAVGRGLWRTVRESDVWINLAPLYSLHKDLFFLGNYSKVRHTGY